MTIGLTHLHSLFRWLILVLLVLTIVRAFSSKEYNSGLKKLSLFTLILAHLQLVIGLVLYFIKDYPSNFGQEGWMKVAITRFWTMEHLMGMIIAIALITIGYSRAKRKSESNQKKKSIRLFYLVALILIIVSIPWPFREGFAVYGWF